MAFNVVDQVEKNYQLDNQIKINEGNEANPDKAARALRLAQATGADPGLVLDDVEGFEKEHKNLLSNEIIKLDPVMQRYLNSDPMAAKVSNDDWGQLGLFSQSMAKWPKKLFEGMAESQKEEFKEVFDTSKDALVDAVRAPGQYVGVGETSDYVKGILSDTEKWMKEKGYKPEAIQTELKTLEGRLRRGESILHATPLLLSFVSPLFAILGLPAVGVFRHEVSRPLEEKAGIPKEVTEGLAMVVAATAGLRATHAPVASDIQKVLDTVTSAETHIKAGERPPTGFHPVIDRLIAEAAKREVEIHDDALKAATDSATRDRSPELFEKLGTIAHDGNVEVESDAVRRLSDSERNLLMEWVPDLEEQLRTTEYTGGSIKIPVGKEMARMDPKLAKALHDDIRLEPESMTLNEAKRFKEGSLEGEFPPASLEDNIKHAAGLDQFIPVLEEPGPTGQYEMNITPIGDRPIFGKMAIGLPKPLYDRMQRLINQQSEDLKAYQEREAEADIRREKTTQWKERFAEERDKVWADMLKNPEWVISRAFRVNQFGGEDIPSPKMDPKFLTPAEREAIPKSYLKKGGMTPDDAAGMLEMDSGREMLDWIMEFEKRRGDMSHPEYFERLINQTTRQVVEKKYGKLEEEILAEKKDRATGITQMERLHQQTLALGLKAGAEITFSKKSVRDWAATRFNSLPFSRKAADEWMRDSGKAYRAIFDAATKGDWNEAFKQSQRQYYSMALVQEAKQLNKMIKADDKLTRMYYKRSVEGRAQESTDWIHFILQKTGRKTSRWGADLMNEIARRPDDTLQKFYDRRATEGLPEHFQEYEIEYTPNMPIAKDLMEGNYKNVNDMTVGEWKAVANTIRAIDKNSKMESRVDTAGEVADFIKLRDELVEQLKTLKERPVKYTRTGEVKPRKFRHMFAGLLQLEHVFARIDRDNPNGAFTKKIMIPMIEAGNNFSTLTRQYSQKVRSLKKFDMDLGEKFKNDVFYEPAAMIRDNEGNIRIPPSGDRFRTMTRDNLRAVMLNMGTDSNFDKMARGHGTTRADIEAFVHKYATEKDWDFVKGIWNIFKDIQRESDRMTIDMSDTTINKLPTRRFNTAFGMVDGGYYPMIYDRATFGFGPTEKLEFPRNTNIKAMTSIGHEKERTGFTAPLNLSISGMTDHLTRRLRDIAFRKVVTEVGKIFRDDTFKRAMSNHMGPEITALLHPFLRDMAGMPGFQSRVWDAGERWLENLRVNMIGSLIGWNPGTVMKHGPTALIHSIQEVGAEAYLEATNHLLKNNSWTTNANNDFMTKGAKIGNLDWKGSEEIQRREQNWRETLAGAEEEVLQPAYGLERIRRTALYYGAKPVAISDLLSTKALWLAKYTQEMRKALPDVANNIQTIEEAHTYANQMAERAIRRAHGSTALTSRPEYMRRQDVMWRSATSLYGFFNNTLGRFYRMSWQSRDMMMRAIQEGKAPTLSEINEMSNNLWAYLILPAVIEEAVTPLTNEEKKSWATLVAEGLVHLASGTIPLIRTIAHSAITGREPSEGMFGAAYSTTANAVRDLTKVQAWDKWHFGKTFQHLAAMAGLALGVGSTQLGRWGRAIYNDVTGVERPRTGADFYNQFRYGTVKPPK